MKNSINEIFDVFDEYAMGYDLSIPELAHKYNHSYRVMHQSDEISKFLNLDEEDTYLAATIGLLHDIARFIQWKNYQTFNDLESIDHGDEAAKILFDDNLISKFNVDKNDYEIIRKSIINHNKLVYDENDLTVREKLHTKIIRDADKIDIYYSLANKMIELQEDGSSVSDAVKKEFFEHKTIDRGNIKTLSDRIVSMFGFVYDLNYDYSKKRILDEGYIDMMYELLNDKEYFSDYRDEVISFLKGEC